MSERSEESPMAAAAESEHFFYEEEESHGDSEEEGPEKVNRDESIGDKPSGLPLLDSLSNVCCSSASTASSLDHTPSIKFSRTETLSGAESSCCNALSPVKVRSRVKRGNVAQGEEKKGAGIYAKKNKKKRNKKAENFSLYISKVLKQVHPDTGLTGKSMVIMNSFVVDMFDKLSTEAIHLVQWKRNKTLSSREIQTAVKLLLPGELSKHALCEGSKAVSKFIL